MEFSATHHYDRPLDQVSAVFLDPDAHVGRYALMGHRDIEILHVEAGDDVLDLKTIRTIDGEVPKMAQRIIKPTNTVTSTDWWGRTGGVFIGRSTIEASNVPGTATTAATIEPAGALACTYTIVLTLDLKVPLIGDRFVTLLRPQVMEIVDAEFEAWDLWFSRSDAA
ncbi:MAG: DUF2505 domain-containing protein [Aquihabitans sp.]